MSPECNDCKLFDIFSQVEGLLCLQLEITELIEKVVVVWFNIPFLFNELVGLLLRKLLLACSFLTDLRDIVGHELHCDEFTLSLRVWNALVVLGSFKGILHDMIISVVLQQRLCKFGNA